jgi:dTDP-glucose 4,6-dehydratase
MGMGKEDQKQKVTIVKKTILVTGGAGFIGSHVVRRFVNNYPNYLIVNADKLTYAGNLENLTDIESKSNYRFEKRDIVDKQSVLGLFSYYRT